MFKLPHVIAFFALLLTPCITCGQETPVELFTLPEAENLELRDSEGQTVLMRAAGNNSPDVIKALVKAGAEVNGSEE